MGQFGVVTFRAVLCNDLHHVSTALQGRRRQVVCCVAEINAVYLSKQRTKTMYNASFRQVHTTQSRWYLANNVSCSTQFHVYMVTTPTTNNAMTFFAELI